MNLKRLRFYFNLILRITLIVFIFFSILEKNTMFVFLSVLTLIFTFLPAWFEKKYGINIPSELEISIVLFLYAGIFLGGVKDFYYRFWWWDSFLHLFSGLALGFIGFLILYVFYKSKKFKANPKIIVLFAFCFALSIGTLWEIFEFGVDEIFDQNMQRSRDLCYENYCDSRLGVRDTMIDLIIDSIGAFIASIAGYFYLKKGEFFVLKKLIKNFEKENNSLFEK